LAISCRPLPVDAITDHEISASPGIAGQRIGPASGPSSLAETCGSAASGSGLAAFNAASTTICVSIPLFFKLSAEFEHPRLQPWARVHAVEPAGAILCPRNMAAIVRVERWMRWLFKLELT
jgi:hypothetical protein